MFVVGWGKKRQAKQMGYAADFCPICREFQPFAIDRLEARRHVFGLMLGSGQTVGFAEVCETCGFGAHGIDVARFKNVRSQPMPLSLLLEATYPNAYVDYTQRLFLEGDVWRSPHQLDADLRRALVQQPFLLLANQAAYRGETQATPWMIAGSALALAALFVLPTIARSQNIPSSFAEPLAALLVFGGLGGVLWEIGKDTMARRPREPLALLLKALRPLDPSREELADALGNLTVRNLRVWRGQSPERLLQRLHALEAAEMQGRSARSYLAEN